MCIRDSIIITDLRFPNEYTFLESIGALIVKTVRDDGEDILEEELAAHESEIHADTMKPHIELNAVSGDIDSLHQGAENIAVAMHHFATTNDLLDSINSRESGSLSNTDSVLPENANN